MELTPEQASNGIKLKFHDHLLKFSNKKLIEQYNGFQSSNYDNNLTISIEKKGNKVSRRLLQLARLHLPAAVAPAAAA